MRKQNLRMVNRTFRRMGIPVVTFIPLSKGRLRVVIKPGYLGTSPGIIKLGAAFKTKKMHQKLLIKHLKTTAPTHISQPETAPDSVAYIEYDNNVHCPEDSCGAWQLRYNVTDGEKVTCYACGHIFTAKAK